MIAYILPILAIIISLIALYVTLSNHFFNAARLKSNHEITLYLNTIESVLCPEKFESMPKIALSEIKFDSNSYASASKEVRDLLDSLEKEKTVIFCGENNRYRIVTLIPDNRKLTLNLIDSIRNELRLENSLCDRFPSILKNLWRWCKKVMEMIECPHIVSK